MFEYDQETGRVTARITSSRRKAGSEVGCIYSTRCGKQYRTVRVLRSPRQLHRIIWMMVYGEDPSGEIDHINGNGLDNSLKNLRVVTHRENAMNQRLRATNKSGVSGVSWEKRRGKWTVRIRQGGKKITVGRFDTFDEAVSARDKAAEAFGYHTNHGTSRPL